MFNIRQSERSQLQTQWNESGLRPHVIERHEGQWFAVVRFRCSDKVEMKPLGSDIAVAKSTINNYSAWCNCPSSVRLKGA